MNKRIYLLLILCIGNCLLIYSQISPCGTVVQQEQVNLENTFTITQGSSTQSLPQLNRTLSVAFFIVKNSSGQLGVTTAQMKAAIDLLNQTFSPIALSFKISDSTKIDNFQLDKLFAGQNELELENSYAKTNVINIFLVTSLYDQSTNDVSGFTYMPPAKKNYIFIKKNNLSGTTLIHQIGHFFDLYHTHETIFGSELVTRPGNCSTAGDRCCDTEADPNIDGLVDTNCIYTGTGKDANNVFYMPSAKNIMSSSIDNCRCYLSNTQFLRVIYALNNFRGYLR